MVNAVPEGTHTITPHLVIKGAAKAIDFYSRAFGAREHYRMGSPDGLIGHAELQIGDSRLYLADEWPKATTKSPQSLKGSSVVLHVYVEDVDALFARAVKAGAEVLMPVTDMFWGDRYGQVKDPFGHVWSLATHKEDLSPEEADRRAREAMAAMPPASPAPKKRSGGRAAAKKRPSARKASAKGKARRKR